MPQIPSSCDVVVIGAGIGGLTAAALLTRAGLEVAVVEAQPRLGGYLAGFERNRFKFDSAIHWLNQCAPGGFVYKMFDHIAPGSPHCPPLERIRRFKSESFDYLLTNNPDELRDCFAEDFRSDAAGIRRMFADAKKINRRFVELSRLMRARETRALWEWPQYGMRMARSGLAFIKHIEVDAEKGLRRYAKNSDFANVFCTEPDILSVLVPLAWAYGGDFQAPPAGGGQMLTQWLAEQVRGGGSQVILNSPVAQIALEGGRAAGVCLERGGAIRAKHVIAACDVESVYERMLPNGTIAGEMLDRLRGADLYDSAFVVSLGLDCPTEEFDLDESMVTLTRDGASREEHSGPDPDKASLCIFSPSLRDKTMAPDGKGTLTVFCAAQMGNGERWGLDPDGTQGTRYKEVKNEYADILLERTESALAPGLRSHIEVTDIATPVTFWRYTRNRDGSMMGARPGRANIKKKIAHYRTPVPGLLLSGHWAEYGGGVPVSVKAGANASLLVLKDLGHPDYRDLCAAMDR